MRTVPERKKTKAKKTVARKKGAAPKRAKATREKVARKGGGKSAPRAVPAPVQDDFHVSSSG